jgi:hypothetical protein
MFVYGLPYEHCEHCGLPVTRDGLDGIHRCEERDVVAHKVLAFRAELVDLEDELAAYLQTRRARNLLAFTRFLEARRAAAAGVDLRSHG